MDKQITIDGVDVSGCKLFRNGICASPINPKCKLCVEISEKMCYYKQLKRKEQEYEELKETLTEIKEIALGVRNYLNCPSPRDVRYEMDIILQKISECEGNNEN